MLPAEQCLRLAAGVKVGAAVGHGLNQGNSFAKQMPALFALQYSQSNHSPQKAREG